MRLLIAPMFVPVCRCYGSSKTDMVGITARRYYALAARSMPTGLFFQLI